MRSPDYYIPLQEVGKLNERRRQDLRPQVEEALTESGFGFPEELREGQFAILLRQVPTFRYEDALFILWAKRAGLTPLWLGKTNDRMAMVSPYKRSLTTMRVVTHVGNRGGVEVRRAKLVDGQVAASNGLRLSEIICDHGTDTKGRRLIDVHDERLKHFYTDPAVVDVSAGCLAAGGAPQEYYPSLLSLAVAHGVIFKDFHGGEAGRQVRLPYAQRTFEPAFQEVRERFRVEPLVVRFPWWKELTYYPGATLSAEISPFCHSWALREEVVTPAITF